MTDRKDWCVRKRNPYYLLQDDYWLLRLGAQVDLSFGFG